MAASRKSWRQKLEDSKDLPKVVDIPANMQPQLGHGRLLIPSPRMVDAAIRTVPRGSTRTAPELRADLARQNKADSTCPLVTGIFCNIAAHAAEEASAAGEPGEKTPWWRILSKDGKPNPKFPGAPDEQIRRLRAEGVELTPPRTPGSRPPAGSSRPHTASIRRTAPAS
jgi:hypothetical protein